MSFNPLLLSCPFLLQSLHWQPVVCSLYLWLHFQSVCVPYFVVGSLVDSIYRDLLFVSIQSWVFIGRTDVEAETPILWPPDVKSWLIGKDPDSGKDWGQEKGKTEDEVIVWHHWLNGHETEQTLGDGEEQGSLECCSPCGCKESYPTKQLNWTQLIHY